MKKCYLDSNVLVYLKDNNSPHQKTTIDLIISLIPEKYELYISSLSIDEFLHSSLFILRYYKITAGECYRRIENALKSILQSQQVRIVNPSISKESNLRTIKIMQDFNLGSRDAYHLLTMQENDIGEFATFDNDFKRVFAKKLLKQVK